MLGSEDAMSAAAQPVSLASSQAAPQPVPTPVPAVQRYFEISLFLLVSTGILAIVSTGKLDPIAATIPPIAIFYKGYRIWRNKGPEISVRFATELVLAYFLFFPLDLFFLSRNLADNAPNPALYAALLATIHLLLFASLVRLYSARTNRDYAFLSVLSVTCMLASAILTVETSFLVALAVFLVLAVSTFVALEMRRAATGAVSPALDPGSPLASDLNRALGITSVFVAAGALAIGTLIFFLIPRYTSGYLSALSLQPSLMTGFGDSVTLGQIGVINQSSAVVMRISFDQNAASEGVDIHWRGLVFTNFDGRRWFTPKRDDIVVTPGAGGDYVFPPRYLVPGQSRHIHYTVLMEPNASDAIFIAPRVTALRGHFGAGAERPGSQVRPGFLLIDHTGSLTNPSHNDSKIRYEGTSEIPVIPPSVLRKAGTKIPDEITRNNLQLPEIDPRIKPLAEDITRGMTNDYDKAANIELYLKTHLNYTLDLSGPAVKDPLANFIFVRKSGNCEYFAAAMTVMLRSIGVPARYVGGFVSGEYNEVGGDWIVRSSDAHTWVEVYFPEYGWMTFDPTPSGGPKSTGLFAQLAKYWDWFQFAWGEWVINYDFVHQISLVHNVGQSSKNFSDNLKKWYQARRDAAMAEIVKLDKATEASPYFLPGLLVVLIVLLMILRGRELLTSLMTRWALLMRSGDAKASLVVFEYREMLRLLEKAGWRKAESQTAEEFAAQFTRLELAGPVSQLTNLYQAARFGEHPARVEQMSALVASIRDAVKRGAHAAK
jgi:transglutaminase-like putative cysteine protease